MRILTLLILALLASVVYGQEEAFSLPADAYYLAPDEAGIIQVWFLSKEGRAEVITHAQANIVDFTVSHDRLSTVYTSGGNLWLEPRHDSDPYVIAEMNPEAHSSASPVFNADDSRLAFANNGIWMYNVDGTEPYQLLENIPYTPDTTDVGTLRYYAPTQFIDETNWLIVEVGLWEGVGAGLLNVETGELVVSESFDHPAFLPLSDGQVLAYGNNVVYGMPDIQLASLDNPAEWTTVMDFTDLIPDVFLMISHAAEVEPGIVRLIGSTLPTGEAAGTPQIVRFDVDLAAGELVSELEEIVLPDTNQTTIYNLSPDGSLAVVYVNSTLKTEQDSRGILTGEVRFYEFETDELDQPDLNAAVSSFTWAD